MPKLKIVRLSDSYDCDHDGCSGGYADGARIELDGVVVAELIPRATCFGGGSFTEADIIQAALKAFGHEVEVTEEYENE